MAVSAIGRRFRPPWPVPTIWIGMDGRTELGAKRRTCDAFNSMVIDDKKLVRIPDDSRRRHYCVAELAEVPRNASIPEQVEIRIRTGD